MTKEHFKKELKNLADYFSYDTTPADINGYWNAFKDLTDQIFSALIKIYQEGVRSGKIQFYKNNPEFPNAAKMEQFYWYGSGLVERKALTVKSDPNDPFPYDPLEWDKLNDDEASTGLAWGIYVLRKPGATSSMKEALKEHFRVAKTRNDECRQMIKDKIDKLEKGQPISEGSLLRTVMGTVFPGERDFKRK